MSNQRPRQFLDGLAGADSTLTLSVPPAAQATVGNGPIAGQTLVFDFNLVNFDWVTWHNYEWQNWVQVDALLNVAIGFLNLRGLWRPDTDYTVGDTVFDPDDPTKLYEAQNTHHSSTDFQDDVTAGHWTEVTEVGPPVTTVFGRIGDIVAEVDDYAAFFYSKTQSDARFAQLAARNTFTDSQLISLANAKMDVRGAGILDYYLSGNDTIPDASFRREAADRTSITRFDAAGLVSRQYVFDRATDIMSDDSVMRRIDADNRFNPLINARMRWRGQWVAGAYAANDVVQDGDYVFIALQSTVEKPDNGNNPPDPVDWDVMSSGGGSSVYVQDTAPATPAVGELWFKTSAPVGLYIYYDDGDSTQWVQTDGGGSSDGSGITEAEADARYAQSDWRHQVQITQAAYDVLSPPDADTMYVVVG